MKQDFVFEKIGLESGTDSARALNESFKSIFLKAKPRSQTRYCIIWTYFCVRIHFIRSSTIFTAAFCQFLFRCTRTGITFKVILFKIEAQDVKIFFLISAYFEVLLCF